MKNSIKITACDNEFYLIACQADKSYEVAHIKSGNSHRVDVEITVDKGNYTSIPTIGDPDSDIHEKYSVNLPTGEYTLIPVCINWGVIWGYEYSLNGSEKRYRTGSEGDGCVGVGEKITV